MLKKHEMVVLRMAREEDNKKAMEEAVKIFCDTFVSQKIVDADIEWDTKKKEREASFGPERRTCVIQVPKELDLDVMKYYIQNKGGYGVSKCEGRKLAIYLD